jgi:hypothetical protein
MPGFDGTGPGGMGPFTGGGRGFCRTRGMAPAYPAYGFGYGRPYGYPQGYGYVPYSPQLSKDQEIGFLKSEAAFLKRELEAIEGRITQLSTE